MRRLGIKLYDFHKAHEELSEFHESPNAHAGNGQIISSRNVVSEYTKRPKKKEKVLVGFLKCCCVDM
jgi:hypothetical protein